MTSAGAVLAELVGVKGRQKNAPVFGTCMRFLQVLEPLFRKVCRCFSWLVFPARRSPQTLSAAGLCPAKLLSRRLLRERHWAAQGCY